MNIKTLTINALFIALVLIATMFINVRLPIAGNGGLIPIVEKLKVAAKIQTSGGKQNA